MLKRTIAIAAMLFWIGVMQSNAQISVMETQDSTSVVNRAYTIGDYQICPAERLVKIFTRIGGVSWDGYEYRPYDLIDFDSTEMYLVGNAVLFKELTSGRDLKDAKFTYPKRFMENDPKIPLIVFDNDSIFEKGYQKLYPLSSTKGKKYLGNHLFEDADGHLYTTVYEGREVSEQIPDILGIDKETIQHLCDDFFYDKNQIYSFDYYTVSRYGRPESRFCRVIDKNEGNLFDVGVSYCCINDQAYLRKRYLTDSIDLDVSTIREYKLDDYYATYLITDGNKTYINSLHYQGTDFQEIEGLSGLDIKPIVANVSTWYYNPKTSMIYLKPDAKEMVGAKGDYGLLMYSAKDNRVFIINREGKYQNYKGILMPQTQESASRPFNSKTDLDLLKNFESYTLYRFYDNFYDGFLKACDDNGIDKQQLTRIAETAFYTDGKNILWLGEASNINQNYGKDEDSNYGLEHIKAYFKNWFCPINDPDNLTVINDNLLADATTLYYIDREDRQRKLMSVPFSDLGIPVFFLERGAEKMGE